MPLVVLNILDALRDLGQETVERSISSFRCSLNQEIEEFLHGNAIEFARRRISITYLVFNDEDQIVAYFTLTHKPTQIPGADLSKNLQKRLMRFALFDAEGGVFNASAFLIAQFGKSSEVSFESNISGSDLMDLAVGILEDVQYRVGGGVVFLECENKEKLLRFYETYGYRVYGSRSSQEGISYQQLLYVM